MQVVERRPLEQSSDAPPAGHGLGDIPASLERESSLEREAPRRPPDRHVGDVPQKSSWRGVSMGMRILGAVGFVGFAAVGGVVANYYGFSTRETVLVSGLLGLFGASLGAVIPPLTKAIGWILLAAGIAAIGIGSLRLLGLLVPEFLERVLG